MRVARSMLLGAALVGFATPLQASAASFRVAQVVQIPTERQLEDIYREINPTTPVKAAKRKQAKVKRAQSDDRGSPATTASTRRNGKANIDAAAEAENRQMDSRAHKIDQKVMKGICRGC